MLGKRKHATTFSSERYDRPQQKNGAPFESLDVAGDESKKAYGHVAGPLDPDYGQRGAFPDYEDGQSGDIFYEPAGDGMQYLRMVRSEAQSVPKLLTTAATVAAASQSTTTDSRRGEGRYDDGAYVASPFDPDIADGDPFDDSDDEDDIQSAYYKALKARFRSFREQVATAPSLTTLPTPSTPTVCIEGTKASQWSYKLKNSKPVLKELHAASQDDVLRGLSRIEALLCVGTAMNPATAANLGCWSWTLLARCREVAALHSESISVIRQLGKKALVTAQKVDQKRRTMPASSAVIHNANEAGSSGELEAPEEAEEAEYHVRDQHGMNVDTAPVEESLEAKKNAILVQLSHSLEEEPEQLLEIQSDLENTILQALGMLDIIVTLVGEEFGQKDLLYGRIAW